MAFGYTVFEYSDGGIASGAAHLDVATDAPIKFIVLKIQWL